MPDIPWPTPLAAILDRPSSDERATKAKLDELRPRLEAARREAQAATDARRALRDREAVMEHQLGAKQAALAAAGSGTPAGRRLAVEIVGLQADLTAIRGTMPGQPHVVGSIDALLVAENRATSTWQELGRQANDLEFTLENLKRKRGLDYGEREALDYIVRTSDAKDPLPDTPLEKRDRG